MPKLCKAGQQLGEQIDDDYPEPTVADKLASVGLSIDDLKSALGLEQSHRIVLDSRIIPLLK
jgi:hypothetical protein